MQICSILFYQLCAVSPFIANICKRIANVSKILPKVKQSSQIKIIYMFYKTVISNLKVINRQYQVEQEKGLLTLTKIELSNKYKSESEISTSSALLLYILSLPTFLPLLSSLSSLLLLLYNISQYSSINYKQIIQQQQEQLVAMQT